MELVRDIEDIAPSIIKRIKRFGNKSTCQTDGFGTMPITVQYELTPSGKSLNKIIEAMAERGICYRKTVFKQKLSTNL